MEIEEVRKTFMEDWGSVHNDADLMSRVLEKVEEK